MASAVLGGLLGYFFHFVVSRKLSVGEYGELQAITSLLVIFAVFSSTLSFFIIKYSSILADHGDQRGQRHFIAFVFQKFRMPVVIFSFSYLAAMPILKNLLRLSDYWGLAAIGLSVIFLVFSSFYVNALQGWRNFLWVGIIGTLIPAAKLGAGFVLSYISPKASAVSFAIFFSAFAGWLVARACARKFFERNSPGSQGGDWRMKYFSEESFRKSMLFILIFTAALAVASNIDILVVKNLTDAQTAGYYGAMSVLGKIILWLNLAVVGVLLPEAFSFGFLGHPVGIKTILSSYALICLVSFPTLVLYYFFPQLLVGALFGAKYLAVARSLWLFGLMATGLSVLTLEGKLALARREGAVPYLLGITIFILIFSVNFFHKNLEQIVISVTVSFFWGWILILAINLRHRFRFARESKFQLGKNDQI